MLSIGGEGVYVCYKVSLFENCYRQSRRAFIDLSIRAKMIGAGLVPFYLN